MKRFRLNLNLTSVIVIIAMGVLLPVMLATAAGIVAIVLAENVGGIVTGVLVISFTVTAAGCGLTAVVLAGQKAGLARLQSDFIANVSHELRTPLSAIRLYIQTLQSGKLAGDPEGQAKCLATILRETEWLDVMIDRVLTWRASSRDMMPLKMEKRPVSQAVEDAVQRFRGMVSADELKLSCSVRSRVCVYHDAGALNSVVLNLLTNAYKYTGKDKKIDVDVKDVGNDVVIKVRDNGIGLGPAQEKRIFQPFYRAEEQDSGQASGAGLGLAIARYLVQRHNGSISVNSMKGKGSTFIIRLPAALEPA